MRVNVLHELPPILHSLQGNTKPGILLKDSHTERFTDRIKANRDLQIHLFSNLLWNNSWNKARPWSTTHTSDLEPLMLIIMGKNGYRMTLKMKNQWSLILYPKPLLCAPHLSQKLHTAHPSQHPFPVRSHANSKKKLSKWPKCELLYH